MPQNNNLKPVQLPMNVKFGMEPKTDFLKLEDSINVRLVDGPTEDQLLQFLPGFVNATWADEPFEFEKYTDDKKFESICKMFKGKTLPTALETLRFTFLITGISLQEVTHILRHRMASFSAVCTGDRFLFDDAVVVPEAIMNSKEFYERYKKVMEDAKQLYVDMVNSQQISLMDARYALPKATDQKYYMSISYKDLVGFVFQRIDRAIQPKSDNIMAYQMWIEACKRLPILAALNIVDFNAPSMFFIKTARSGNSTNLYIPETQNDKFEWNEKDFIYQKTREELCGTDEDAKSTFMDKLNAYIYELNDIKNQYLKNHKFADIIKKYQ